MPREQTTPATGQKIAAPRDGRRIILFFLAAAAVVGGCAAMAAPFLVSSTPWVWQPRTRRDLASGTIRGELIAIDERGVRLSRRGSRPISIITPPLRLSQDTGRVARVRASLPGVPPGASVTTKVHFFWQTRPGAGFSFVSREVVLGEKTRSMLFSLPVSGADVHRLGIQFPELPGPVCVQSVGLPDATFAERCRLAAQQFAALEAVANYSINFVRGPLMVGRGLNYYWVSATAVVLGGGAFVCLLRRRRLRATVVAGVVLAGWLVADARATWHLMRQAKAEVAHFRNRTGLDRIAAADGGEIAWACEQMSRQAAAGTTFAVVSDDPFTPAHRLAYRLAPRRARRASYEDADYIVVIHSTGARHDEEAGRFRVGDGRWVFVELIAAASPDLYLLRVCAERPGGRHGS